MIMDDIAEPIVQAPLAGGPSTSALASAVCEAGGLGFLAAGYRSPDELRRDIAAVRAATNRPFGVNLFVPSDSAVDDAAIERYLTELRGDAQRSGTPLGRPRLDDDAWPAKLSLVIEERVPLVSFTFGCPPAEAVLALHVAGIELWVTITDVVEASEAEGVGADALIVQGVEAGGHRASFVDDDSRGGLGLLPLLRLVAGAVRPPLVAAGGLADGFSVAAALAAGARAAQLGTAFMLCPEAGTSAPQREALRRSGATALTRAFTGRRARGIINGFMREHTATAPSGYPQIHHATAPLRAAARQRGDVEAINLWAGEAYSLAEPLPAGELVRRLGRDARRALDDARRQLD